MPNSSLSYPKIRKDSSGKYFIDLNLNNKRYRLYSGKIIKSSPCQPLLSVNHHCLHAQTAVFPRYLLQCRPAGEGRVCVTVSAMGK